MENKGHIEHWAESNNRTKVLQVEERTKNGGWIRREKLYSQDGFSPSSFVNYWHVLRMASDEFNNGGKFRDIRLLNAMGKQVYSRVNRLIMSPFRSKRYNLVSIRKPGEKFDNSHIINISDNLDEFKLRLMAESEAHGGFKSFNSVTKCQEDNYLEWYKLAFNDGEVLHIALYN